ncbi:hypothetical protein RHMOL_Rhmol03G0128600 [Rhododendron molle]|uniref:Uncharacterized protein n=1 Tax=Rhododendron molle TaxID=49168 RepID=A0ACC0PEV8_RHOML|nr:hypothetical protein RHMOL_Rhmol03G0128600 [Rhododendron molle]
MARVYLLYLFGATLYANKRAIVHLSYLPALYDLRTASRYNWGGAALGTCYGFMGESSRGKKAAAGYWRIWEVEWNPWRNAEPEPEYVAKSRVVIAGRVLLESAFGWQWYLGDRMTRPSLGTSEFVVPGLLPPHASHTSKYTLAQGQVSVQRGVKIRDEPQFRRELRKRPVQKKPAVGPAQKKRREEEEEEEEEEQPSFSNGSDSASDPRFWIDPRERDDDDNDDDGDEGSDDFEDFFDD